MTLERDIERAFTIEAQKALDLKNANRNQLKIIEKNLLEEIKDNIKKGISPISGSRFPAYKNPKRYPGKRKPKRPVNLFLTGQFLRSLRVRVNIVGQALSIRVFFTNEKAKDKERGHRDGANGQPKRPIIPAPNQLFSKRIMLELRRALTRIFSS